MRVLGIETSAAHSSVAVVEDEVLQGERYFAGRMSLSETLPAHVQAVLETEDVAGAGLDALAVSLGPGSFTGLRVGVAAAKAMAHALELPLVGIPTHEALAWPFAIAGVEMICVLQHARKADVYSTTYGTVGDATLAPVHETGVLSVEECLTRLRDEAQGVLLVGDGCARHEAAIRELLGDLARIAPPVFCVPRAGIIATMATPLVHEAAPDAHFSLRPIYVLVSQAERTHGVDLGLK